MIDLARDPDALYDDAVVVHLTIAIRRNGAMSVEGDINNLASALAMLDAAKDSVRNWHSRQRVNNGGLVLPASETPQ